MPQNLFISLSRKFANTYSAPQELVSPQLVLSTSHCRVAMLSNNKSSSFTGPLTGKYGYHYTRMHVTTLPASRSFLFDRALEPDFSRGIARRRGLNECVRRFIGATLALLPLLFQFLMVGQADRRYEKRTRYACRNTRTHLSGSADHKERGQSISSCSFSPPCNVPFFIPRP